MKRIAKVVRSAASSQRRKPRRQTVRFRPEAPRFSNEAAVGANCTRRRNRSAHTWGGVTIRSVPGAFASRLHRPRGARTRSIRIARQPRAIISRRRSSAPTRIDAQ